MNEPISSTSPRTIRLMTALLLLATFALGSVAGAGLTRWVLADALRDGSGRPPHFGPLPLRELDLSDQQRDKAWAILERHRSELDAVLRENFPRVKAINERIEDEVRELLTPEQRNRLDELKRRGPTRFQRHDHGSGPDGFDPFGGRPPMPLPPGSLLPPNPPDMMQPLPGSLSQPPPASPAAP